MMNLTKKRIRKIFNIFSLYRSSENVSTFPVAMQVEMSCGCNLKCEMCVLSKITRDKGKMTFQTFKIIYDQINPDTVVLTGYGETLLNKDIIKIIKYAKENRSSVHMDTNSTLLNETIARKLIESGIDLIKVSVDAATKETYQKIRIGSDYNLIWSNIKKFIQLKKDMKKRKPALNLSFIIQPTNFEEMDKIIEMGNNLGKVDVLFGIVTDYGNNKEGTYNYWKDINNKNVLDKFNSGIKISKELRLKKTYKTLSKSKRKYLELIQTKKLQQGPCFWPWSSVFITWDGYIKPCCYFYDKDMIMGDITNDNFKNIWNNDKYKKFRKNLVNNRGAYLRCSVCGCDEEESFNKIDKYLKYIPFLESKYKKNKTR